jgi:hypothetical protein
MLAPFSSGGKFFSPADFFTTEDTKDTKELTRPHGREANRVFGSGADC